MKLCNHCREAMEDNDQICPHCGVALNGRVAQAAPETSTIDVTVPDTPGSRLLRLMYIVVIVLVLLVIAYNGYMIVLGR